VSIEQFRRTDPDGEARERGKTNPAPGEDGALAPADDADGTASRAHAGPLPRAEDDGRVCVTSDTDIVTARKKGRALALQQGFSSTEATMVATAISELARNIVLYAGRGEIILIPVEKDRIQGLVIIARDEGPGISDVELAMREGYSTAGRLGVGLPGVGRLVDEWQIISRVGMGTTVIAKKWNGGI
jgi:serine/threonine-protein kinase RsbT